MLRNLAVPGVLLLTLVGFIEYDRHANQRRPLSQDELEAVLRDKFDLTSLTLTERPGGRFTGTGVGDTGRVYRFVITQTQTERQVLAEYEGDGGRERGTIDTTRFYSDPSSLYLILAVIYAVWVVTAVVYRLLATRPQFGPITVRQPSS